MRDFGVEFVESVCCFCFECNNKILFGNIFKEDLSLKFSLRLVFGVNLK
jgi:hypothetical protein